MKAEWIEDVMQPRTDRLYADFTLQSQLLPVERPWLFRIGDLVLVDQEFVQVIDGFLHVNREFLDGRARCAAPAGSTVTIISSASGTGSWLR